MCNSVDLAKRNTNMHFRKGFVEFILTIWRNERLVQSINGWLFFDPAADELHEEYPRRTLAVNTSKSSGKFAIICYDFPKGTDIRVEMNVFAILILFNLITYFVCQLL